MIRLNLKNNIIRNILKRKYKDLFLNHEIYFMILKYNKNLLFLTYKNVYKFFLFFYIIDVLYISLFLYDLFRIFFSTKWQVNIKIKEQIIIKIIHHLIIFLLSYLNKIYVI